MRYWRINTLGNEDDENRCVLDENVEGIGVEYWRLGEGAPCVNHMPSPARIPMSPERPGLRLGHLLSTTRTMLLVHREVKDCIVAQFTGGAIEYFEFDLIDHKGRVRSRDYVIVNPLGAQDCVNPKESRITYFKNTQRVVAVDRLVLDPDKLVSAPCLFHVKEEKNEYFINDTLAEAFRQHNFSNIVLTEVETLRAG
jgi:hypothetical protein